MRRRSPSCSSRGARSLEGVRRLAGGGVGARRRLRPVRHADGRPRYVRPRRPRPPPRLPALARLHGPPAHGLGVPGAGAVADPDAARGDRGSGRPPRGQPGPAGGAGRRPAGPAGVRVRAARSAVALRPGSPGPVAVLSDGSRLGSDARPPGGRAPVPRTSAAWTRRACPRSARSRATSCGCGPAPGGPLLGRTVRGAGARPLHLPRPPARRDPGGRGHHGGAGRRRRGAGRGGARAAQRRPGRRPGRSTSSSSLEAQTGLRPATADNTPVVGWTAPAPGWPWPPATSATASCLAPSTAAAVVDLFAAAGEGGERADPDGQRRSPDRARREHHRRRGGPPRRGGGAQGDRGGGRPCVIPRSEWSTTPAQARRPRSRSSSAAAGG